MAESRGGRHGYFQRGDTSLDESQKGRFDNEADQIMCTDREELNDGVPGLCSGCCIDSVPVAQTQVFTDSDYVSVVFLQRYPENSYIFMSC